jgi:two-component system NtrC family sensor kinase
MQHHFFGYFAKGGILYPFFGLGGLFATVYILVLLNHSIRHEKSSIRKNKLKYVFSGFGIMGLMNSLNILPLLGYSVYPPGNLSFLPLIFFGVGLFRHDLLDMGILIKKSLIYSILMALLTCLYALIIIGVDIAFKGFDFTDSILFPILFFLLIAVILGPIKSRIQTFVDRIFFKEKADYQKTIKNVSQMIVSILDLNEIGKRLTHTVVEALAVKNCIWFLKKTSASDYCEFSIQGEYKKSSSSISIGNGSLLVRYLEKNRQPLIRQNLLDKTNQPAAQKILSEMYGLEAEVILPTIFKNRLNGFVLLGEKLSGDLFSKEDLDLLETLASQTALAIENARSYEKIEDLNKNLEGKIAERTLSLQEALLEKEKTQEQLIRAESLAAIGQLVAGVAHELNNPLTSVKSLIQTTIEDLEELKHLPLDQEMLDDLHFADKELERAKLIVKSLLDISRQTQTFSESVQLNTVVKDALRVLHNQYKNLSLKIVESFGEALPVIQGNFANLGQVMLNIIQNAIQAVTKASGTIYLSTYFDENSQQVIFQCRDTGPGIPEKIRNDIFKPFFTTKEVGQGTGLGLYISHEIIQRHGGTISLDNLEKTGACFNVRLPIQP